MTLEFRNASFASLPQQRHHILGAAARGSVQRRLPAAITIIEARALGQQQLRCLHVPGLGCRQPRRVLADCALWAKPSGIAAATAAGKPTTFIAAFLSAQRSPCAPQQAK